MGDNVSAVKLENATAAAMANANSEVNGRLEIFFEAEILVIEIRT